MTCREAQHQLFSSDSRASAAHAEPGAAASDRAQLDAHVASCADCRRMQASLNAVLHDWRKTTADVAVPDSEREWQAVRRRIRNGDTPAASPSSRRVLPWLALPLAAAAAIALLFVDPPGASRSPASPTASGAQIARADSVEVPGGASPLVYVDDKSGWLIVWANDAREI